jgi:division/cell wall cluster transcriptional repressor MraZ
MPAPAAQKVTYQSLHRYTVDANRRVQMPLAWRSAKPVELTMIVWPQHDCGPCLRVLPPDQMDKLREKIELMAPAEKTSLKRHIGSSSIKVELDSAKRIAIPLEMADAVGIRNDAVFAGMLDYFEIWSPERYADMHSQEKRVVANVLKSLE